MTRDPRGFRGASALAAGLLFSIGLPVWGQTDRRTEALYALMAVDPAGAARSAEPELRGEWQGHVVAVIEDDLRHNRQHTRYRAHIGNSDYELYFAGPAPELACNRVFRIGGVRLRDRMVAETATPVAAVTSGGCTTTGPQQTAAILLGFPSTPLPPGITPGFVQNALFGARSVNGYYNEVSYGQVSFTGGVFGPYTADADYSCTDIGLIEAAAIRAVDPYVDLTQYTRIVIVMPDVGCGWEGAAEIGCVAQTSPAHGVFTASVSWISIPPVITSDQMIAVTAHEAGHNFGLNHAHSLDFGAQPLGQSGGIMSEYGDPFSVMGTTTWFGHLNAQEKLALGWIDGTRNVATVQGGGTFTLAPLELASAGVQALKVQRGVGGASWLWLEYRQPAGAYEAFSSIDNEVYTGALIHYDDGSGTTPLATSLLDFNAVQTPNNFLESALPVGRMWSDPYSSLSLTVTGASPSGLGVTVSYNNTAFAAPPSLSFTGGGSQTVSLTSSGPAFSFTVAASGGSWLSATPASGAVPATLTVTANAANLTAGTYNGSIAITVPGAVNSPLTVPVTLTVPAAGVAGYWTFDSADISGSQALDRSGNGNIGLISNATSVAGRLNQALSFSGAGSYVAVAANAAFELTHDLTLAAWIRTQNNSQTQNFIGKYDFTGSESGYLLQVLPSGVLNLHLGGGNLASVSRDAADTTPINDGQWHHVAVVIAMGQNVSFYVDGALSSTQPQVAMAWANLMPLYLGTSPGAYHGSPFIGALDDVRIYASRLSGAQIQALVGTVGPSMGGIAPATAPQGSAVTLTVSGSGFVSGAVLIEPDAPTTPAGLRVLATTFVSSTQLTVAVPRDLTMSPGTLRFQVFNSYPSGPSSNIAGYTVTPLAPAISSLSPASVTSGGADFTLTVNGANFVSSCACIQQLEPGAVVEWNGAALATTFVSATQLIATVPAALTASAGTVSVAVVNPGSVGSGASTFTIASKAPPPLTLSCTPTAGPAGMAPYTAACTASGGAPPYAWSISAGSLPAGLALNSGVVSGTPTAAGPYSFTVRVMDAASQSAIQSYSGTISAPPPTTAAPAAWWTFDTADLSGARVLDRSGNNLAGTLVNATPVAGRVNQALSFSGAGSYVAVPDSAALELTQSLTFAAWIQTTNNAQKQDFLSKYDFTASEYGYLLQVLPTGAINVHVGGNNLLSGNRDAADTTPINDGQWHHVAVVLTLGQNVAFYIDGRLSSTQPLATLAARDAASLYLGTFPGSYNGSPFTGALDEVRIYDQPLAAADIAALAGASSPLPPPTTTTLMAAAHWTFDTAYINGSQVLDSSGNGLTGSAVNAVSVAGKINQALSFSGAGSYVSVPDNAGLRLTHDLTLAAWIQTTNNAQTQDFLSKYDFNGWEAGYLLQVLPSGVINLHVGGNSVVSAIRDARDVTAVNDGRWHHVAVVIALGQSVTFYIDGRLSSTVAMQTAAYAVVSPLYIGTFPGSYNGSPFTGAMDDVWVYPSALTASQVAAVAAGTGS
jgi:M6 family metalloprotease-like protein